MEIIFETKFGSHLYGVDTTQSDMDYKGVFIASFETILLGHNKHSFVDCKNGITGVKKNKGFAERNTKEDIDVEYKELRRFISDCISGQTYALDMLFANTEMWTKSSDEWKFIVENRHKLLSKNVQPYIGYCRQQAGKYGLKGSRLGELIRVIEHLEKFDTKDLLGDAVKFLILSEFVYLEQLPSKKGSEIMVDFLHVLGKKFQLTTHISEALKSLNHMRDKYGERAEQAKNNEGIDWKAVSHAFRCCYQLIELALTHQIKFPLDEREKIKRIKAGKLNYTEIQDDLYKLMEKAIKAVADSSLPEQADREFWDTWLLSVYKKRI